jgi:hypothetical protein
VNRTIVVAMLAACGSPHQPPPQSIGNSPAEAAPRPGVVSGTILDENGAPLIGATIVIMAANGEPSSRDEDIRLAKEQGYYFFDDELVAGPHVMRIYYGEMTFERTFVVEGTTTVNQQVNTHMTSPEIVHCSDAALSSCH